MISSRFRLYAMLIIGGFSYVWPAFGQTVEVKKNGEAPSSGGLAQSSSAQGKAGATKIAWETDFNTALAKAKAANKVIMVDFYTDWCHWCKVLDEKTYTDSRVIEAAGQMISAKIDADKNQKVVSKYNVEGYPAILFLKSDGTEIHRISGFRPPEDFLPDMKAVLKGVSPQQELEEMIKKGTEDPAALQRIGMSLLQKGENAKALPYMEKAAAKLKGKDALKVQQYLPLLYLDAKQVEKANAALEEFRKNPAADAMDVNRVEMRIALTQQDRKRAEGVLDKMKATASPEEKDQIEQFRKNLDEVMKSFAKQAKQ